MAVETRDPVCGMEVNPDKARHSIEHEGTTYLFCCGGCQTAFQQAPDQFLGAGVVAEPSPQPGASSIYVCPMCPDVRETAPVPCPSWWPSPPNPAIGARAGSRRPTRCDR